MALLKLPLQNIFQNETKLTSNVEILFREFLINMFHKIIIHIY